MTALVFFSPSGRNSTVLFSAFPGRSPSFLPVLSNQLKCVVKKESVVVVVVVVVCVLLLLLLFWLLFVCCEIRMASQEGILHQDLSYEKQSGYDPGP